MVDRDLVLKKLAFIETCVSELRALARPEAIASDLLDFAGAIRERLLAG